MRAVLYVVSFLFPIGGFIIGIVFYLKPEDEYKHVGKICIVLGIVGAFLIVGLAALLYLMVLGFGGTVSTPAVQVLRMSSVADGYRFAFTATTSEVRWTDVTFQLDTDSGVMEWDGATTEALTSSVAPATQTLGVRSTGSLSLLLSVTDLAGNGRMDLGDYITVTATVGSFSPATSYTLMLLYEPTDGSMLVYQFSG